MTDSEFAPNCQPFLLASLIRDPMVRAAFERADRDNGAAPIFVPANPKAPVLTGGELVEA
ncbi:hypothetical protein L1787_12920 [Acuticoccus sp. M5D2P5]|uniref:hypothetical protein n=1 Tax=Acuticoccus kalidii TaxID=2910977 RepID=UPI001F222FA7|nr:hypothetical protein [Acuticoccus kalidii]MCF3934311.1 hypothetical protein [Acuticoccus kalidii]